MPVDPNVYALSIQLSMDTTEAFAKLDDVGDRLVSIEQNFEKAASSILDNIRTISSDISKSLADSIVNVSSMESKHIGMTSSMLDYKTYIEDSNKTMLDDLNNLIKIEEKWKDISDHHTQIEKLIKDESAELDKFVGVIEGIDKAIKEKNKSHSKENDYVKKEQELLNHICRANNRIRGDNEDLVEVLGRVAAAVSNIFTTYSRLTESASEFRTINFRLYGSMMDLLNASQLLSGELGISEQAAIAIYKELANTRAPKAEIEKLARTVGRLSVITGITSGELIKYSKSLRAAGFTAKEQEKSMLLVAKAMKEYGLSSEEAARSIAYTTTEILNLQSQLGGSKEEVTKLIGTMMQLKGIAGLDNLAGGIEDFQNKLKDPTAMMAFMQSTGVNIRTAEDFSRAALIAGDRMAALEDRIKGASGDEAAQLTAEFNAQAEALYGSAEAGRALAANYRRLQAEALALNKDITKLTEKEIEALLIKSGAYDSLTEQLNLFTGAINALIQTTVVRFITDGLEDILTLVNYVISEMRELAVVIYKYGKSLYETSPAVKLMVDGFMVLFPYIRGFVVLLMLGITVAGALGVSITALYTSFVGLGNVIAGAASVVRSMAASMLTIARAIGQSIIIVLTSIGQGLATMGRAIMPVIPALLTLAAVSLSVGTAVYLVAVSLGMMKEAGWESILMLSVVLVVMGLFIVALMALAAAATPLIPALLTLSAVMISIGAMVALIGAGVMMMGLGVLYVGQGMEKMAASLSAGLVSGVVTLAGALTVLGASAWYNLRAISNLANSFRTLGDSIKLGMDSIRPLIDTMQTLKNLSSGNITAGFSETLLKIGENTNKIDLSNMKKIAADLSEAVKVLRPILMPFLYVSTIIGIAGWMFSIGANGISTGAIALDKSAGLLLPASEKLLEGTNKLLIAMPKVLEASIDLMINGIFLTIGSALMLVGSAALMVAGVAFLVASVVFAAGAGFFAAGAMAVKYGSDLLTEAAISLVENSTSILKSLGVLLSASVTMIIVGSAMLLGGTLLLAGSIVILAAAAGLGIAFAALSLLATTYSGTIETLNKLGDSLKFVATGVESMFSVSTAGVNALAGMTSALSSELDALIIKLDEYATAFEATAIRISDAISDKVMPAMKSAQGAGFNASVRAESIIQNPVMVREGQQIIEPAPEATEKTNVVSDEGSRKTLEQILSLMQTFLPELADGSGRAFGNKMSGW